MLFDGLRRRLQAALSPRRFEHSLSVAYAAADLAQRHGENSERAFLAGLLHDCGRELTGEQLLQTARAFGIVNDDLLNDYPGLLHGPVGALLAWKEYGVDDGEILSAIAVHTLGTEKMSVLSKIVYVADYIELQRDFPEVVELRTLAVADLNAAVLETMNLTIRYVLKQSLPLHPQTIRARNCLLAEMASCPRKEEERIGPD